MLENKRTSDSWMKSSVPSELLVAVHSGYMAVQFGFILRSNRANHFGKCVKIFVFVLSISTLCVYTWLQVYRCKQLLSTIDPTGLGWTALLSWHTVQLLDTLQKPCRSTTYKNILYNPTVQVVDRMHWKQIRFCNTGRACGKLYVADSVVMSVPHIFYFVFTLCIFHLMSYNSEGLLVSILMLWIL